MGLELPPELDGRLRALEYMVAAFMAQITLVSSDPSAMLNEMIDDTNSQADAIRSDGTELSGAIADALVSLKDAAAVMVLNQIGRN